MHHFPDMMFCPPPLRLRPSSAAPIERDPPPMIRLINARKNFGRQTLYDGIDASIVRGERIGLLGQERRRASRRCSRS